MTSPFGTTAAGEPAHLVTLTGDDGVVVRVTDYGAAVVEVHVPDREGRLADVTLGFDDVSGYESPDNMSFGATVGRVANRIAGARFTLDGHEHRLTANEEPGHAIHGGPDRALSRVLWQIVEVEDHELVLRYVSPDGEEGYPGTVAFTARYRLEGRGLEVRYEATTDRRTPVNLTNHAYWNLAGAGTGTALDHQVMIAAERYTVADEELIPTGEIVPVAGTALDLRIPTRVGERIAELESTGAFGYDHNFVLEGEPGQARLAAWLCDPGSGRVLELYTDQPGMQFYSGNRLTGQRAKNGQSYVRNGGLCLEPHHHPDALHRPEFSSIVLDPGDTYVHETRWLFGTTETAPPRSAPYRP